MKAYIITMTTDVKEDIGTVEELMICKDQLRAIYMGYQEMNLDPPDWVIEKQAEINTEINLRVRSELQRKLREKRARLQALTPRAEMRKNLEAEVQELEDKLK